MPGGMLNGYCAMATEHLNALPGGYQLEEYKFERVLGAGGFGITYLAHEKTLKRKVAIKEFLPRDIAMRGDGGVTIHPVSSSDLEDYEYGLERFRDEARTLVSFRHPNIVAVHRLLEANNTAYLVMEYEEGDTKPASCTAISSLPTSMSGMTDRRCSLILALRARLSATAAAALPP